MFNYYFHNFIIIHFINFIPKRIPNHFSITDFMADHAYP